jgi:hypothetical protein
MSRRLFIFTIAITNTNFFFIIFTGQIDEIQDKSLSSFAFIFDNTNDLNKYKHVENNEIIKYKKNETTTSKRENFNLNKNDNILKLYIEIVICTDYSIYKLHKSILKDYLLENNGFEPFENDNQLIVNHIKAYYMQIINGVSENYCCGSILSLRVSYKK